MAVFDPDRLSPEAMLPVQGLFRNSKISDEKFPTELGSQLLPRTLVRTASVTVNAASAAGNMPSQVEPALGFVRSATRSPSWATPCPLLLAGGESGRVG